MWVAENIESEIFENLKISPRSYCPFPSMARDFLVSYYFFLCCSPLSGLRSQVGTPESR